MCECVRERVYVRERVCVYLREREYVRERCVFVCVKVCLREGEGVCVRECVCV